MTEDEEVRLAAAIKRAFQSYEIVGTSEHANGDGPPFRPPWHLIDASKAEPEVNWPGELIQTFPEAGGFLAASDLRWRLIARDAAEAIGLAALAPKES